MGTQKTATAAPDHTLTRQALRGGALIDAHGREIPITESMIQRACRELEQYYQPRRKHA